MSILERILTLAETLLNYWINRRFEMENELKTEILVRNIIRTKLFETRSPDSH